MVSENCKWRIHKGFAEGELINLRFMYGYRIEKGKIEINTDEAEIVRMIFKDYIEGIGCTSIAKKLRDMGISKIRSETWNSEESCRDYKKRKIYKECITTEKVISKGRLSRIYHN